MTTALDTDVLIHWAIEGCEHHAPVRRWLDAELEQGRRIAIAPQVLFEFLHVVTDGRRFAHPAPIERARDLARAIWSAPETRRLELAASPDRVCQLLERHALGRKRILDTALAATLEQAGIARLATFNARDFRIFAFLELVDPAA